MRNLKRALSLALAFVMVMSLMIVGTSAKSYTDADKIDNQVAVEILGELGVMIGNDDGSFAPDRDVTRAEMAVLITRILYGNNLNVDQFKAMNTFTDVPDWAEGFVNLCASLDIIAGRGNGIFDPDATVTSAEAALMLSRALGYFKNNAEFGNDWALAAMKRATQVGIIGGDMVLQANAGLDRDDVAQMTFNTLTKAVPVQYNELLDVYYNVNQGVIYALEFNYLQTLGYKNFSLVYKTNDQVEYGRPATTWGIGSYNVGGQTTASGIKKDKLTSEGGLLPNYVRMLEKDEIITVTNTPVYTYTNSTSQKDIYSDLGAAACNQVKYVKYDWTAFTNGEEVDAKVPAKNNSSTYDFTGKGAVTEIYVDDDAKTVTVVEINYYLGQVASVDADKDTVSIRTVSDLKKDNAKLDDKTFATTEFEKGAYVVFTIDQNGDDDFVIREMMAPETVDGTVTRVNKDAYSEDAYLYLDKETKYDYSGIGHMAYDLNNENVARHPELEKEYTLYLDPNGYVLAYSTDISKNFLYVEDSDEERFDWVADVVLDDGSDKVISVDSDLKDGPKATFSVAPVNEISWVSELDQFNALKANFGGDKIWPDESELSSFNEIRSKISDIDYQIWEYSTNSSDVYTLTGRETQYATGVQINNGKAYMRSQLWPTDVTIDNSTIFVDVQNNKAYTGYNEVPDVSHAKIAYVLKGDNDRAVAEIVYIIDGDIYDADAIFFVLTSTTRDTELFEGDKYWEFDDMYVDGRKTDGLYVSYDALGKDVLPEAGQVYKVLKSIDGKYITEIVPVTNWDPAAVATGSALDVMDGWMIDNWNTHKYTTDNDTIYVMVEDQYNNAMTKVTGYDVSVAGYEDIMEWTNGDWWNGVDEEGYTTFVSVVKDDDQAADLVYIWRFSYDFYFRHVTVNLDGTEISAGNIWFTDNEISGNSVAIGKLYDQGYTFTSNIGNVTVDGDNWEITNIPNGREDLTINITSSHEDILVNGNLTLNTMDAKDGAYDPHAGNIWKGNSSTIFYNFEFNDGTIPADATVSWTETVYVDSGDGNKQVTTATKTGTLDANLRVEGQTTPDYTVYDKVTVVISDLKVTLKAEEPVAEEAKSKLASVTVDSANVELAKAYANLSDAIANATKINMSSSAAQEYKVVVKTQTSTKHEDLNTYGGIALYNSASAAKSFTPSNTAFNASGYTYSNVSVGSYLIINTNDSGTIAYYAYYFG